jgi:hypothetical protein
MRSDDLSAIWGHRRSAYFVGGFGMTANSRIQVDGICGCEHLQQGKHTEAHRAFSTGAKLFVQGTNQAPLEVVSVDQDIFVAESVGAEIDFERDANGKVIALTLKQRGQILRGERH